MRLKKMISKFFKIQELVSVKVYKKYGDKAWEFFDPRLIVMLDYLKETYGWTININDWLWDGDFQQRGLRCNLDPLVKHKTLNSTIYCSAHVRGQAVDFDVTGLTSQQVRDILFRDKKGLPFNIRLEDGVNWVHLDMVDKNRKIYYFNS